MSDYKRSAKITLGLTYFFMFLLAVATITLPWMVTWYVESKGRPQDLATTVMLTCYPCVPLAAVALLSLRKLLINIISGKILIDQNIYMVKRVSLCCFTAGIIMIIAGFFYMPFYIAGAAAETCALVLYVVKNLLSAGKTLLAETEETE